MGLKPFAARSVRGEVAVRELTREDRDEPIVEGADPVDRHARYLPRPADDVRDLRRGGVLRHLGRDVLGEAVAGQALQREGERIEGAQEREVLAVEGERS